MHEERLAIVKKEIRSVIITYPKGVSLNGFLKTYHQLVGVRLPSRVFGFTSDVDFLYSLEDTVKVRTDKHGDIILTCIADDSTEHIQKLVLKQRNVKTKNVSARDQRPVSHSSRIKPFVSASLRKNLFEVLKDFPDGISYSSLLLAYQKKFKRPLNLEFLSENRCDRLRKLELAISELQIKTIDETERLFYCPLVRKNGIPVQSSSVQELPQPNGQNLETFDIPIIPHVIRQDFEKLLKLCPDGVLARHFPFLYEKMSGEMFELADLGFNNFLELADALPEVFICVKPYESPNEWMLFHTCFSENAEKLRKLNEALQLSEERFGRENETHIQAIPSDIVLPRQPYSPADFPIDLNLSKYFPVFISAAANPGCFWFKLVMTEVINRFKELEDKLQLFYHSEKADAYQMSPTDIKIGTTCVAMHDDHWYRTTVTSHPNAEIVKVYLVDYGSWEKVQCSKVRYLRNSFNLLPEQAFKAQLSAVKPINNSKVWNKTATRRFLQLCSKPYVMAQVHLQFGDTLSVYLCDTYGDDDIYVNDTLVDEQLAEHCFTTDLSNLMDSVSDVRSVEDVADNYCADSQSVNMEGCGGSSNSLTVVERVYLGDGYWSHIIMISKTDCYMTAADLCNLFWRDKSVEVLKSRLRCKNIEIHATIILRDDQKDLFLKCESSGVHGFSPLHPSVELYPLSAVMKVLNCLGHPSIEVRDAIQTVLKDQNGIYDLLKKTTDYCDTPGNPISSKDDINKLCLHDLKAKLETVKCKRLVLLKKYEEIPRKEIKNDLFKAESLLGIIENRIEDINCICMSYSNYE